MTKYSELIEKAVAALEENDELFIRCVDELDSWMGFCDGFRVFNMYELNDLYIDRPVSALLEDIGENHFSLSDEYFVDTIYGLKSIDDKYQEYLDNTDEGEVLDNLLDNYDNIDIKWIDEDFDRLLQEIIETRDSES